MTGEDWFWSFYPLMMVAAVCLGQGLVLYRRKRQRERWGAWRAAQDEMRRAQ